MLVLAILGACTSLVVYLFLQQREALTMYPIGAAVPISVALYLVYKLLKGRKARERKKIHITTVWLIFYATIFSLFFSLISVELFNYIYPEMLGLFLMLPIQGIVSLAHCVFLLKKTSLYDNERVG